MLRLRSVLAATALAGAIAILPMVAQQPVLHALFDGTGLDLLQSAPFRLQRG